MESGDPAVAAMHPSYAATFDPSVYVRCAPRAGCPRSGHHVFHGARAAARAATCEFCNPPPPSTAPPPGVALPASAAGMRALQRQHALAAASAAHDAALAATARCCAEIGGAASEAGDAVRAGFSVCGMPQLWRGSRDVSELHNYHMEAGELPADSHRRAAKLTVVQELHRARQALDTADLGMVSDAAAALHVLEGLHPPLAPTDPEYSPPEEPRRALPLWGGNEDEVRRWGEDKRRVMRRAPCLSAGHVDWWRWEHIKDLDVPSWRMWVNRCGAGRSHSRTAAFFASGTVLALHKDDPAAREERAKTGGPLRVRPLGVGSVFVRLASAHALVHVGADAREAVGSVAHAAWLEGIASFGTSGYGFDHGAMRLLVVCAVRQTGFLNRMMPPSELDPFLEAVDAANISAAFSLLGLDACDQSTPRMEAAIVQYE
eukprot:jgi/Tetstr1/445816/TSEL_033457.t1